MQNLTKIYLILSCILGSVVLHANEIYPFFLPRADDTFVEGYFSPPATPSSPIIFAIQGSACESVLAWHKHLSDEASALGLGVITLEKQGISKEGINLLAYNQTNCLQSRLNDYVLVLENRNLICSQWEGKPIFWGESEGGMLAAALGGQTPQTAAVVLFAAGGGMKPCEEVKWALQHRMETLGAGQEEIDQYMSFLNEQMDVMRCDPTPEKQFLGNTYKWWASLLCADEAAMPLNQQSFPIFLVHGAKDSRIPIQSADIAAETLSKSNTFTYLRLEEYGHDLNTADIHDVTYRWLASVLFGQEPAHEISFTQVAPPPSDSLEDSQANMSDYVFSRGGNVQGRVRVEADSEGNKKTTADLTVNHNFRNRCNASLNGGKSRSERKGGNVKKEMHVEVTADYEY